MTDTVNNTGAFRYASSGGPGDGRGAARKGGARRSPATARTSTRPILRHRALRRRDVLLSGHEPDARAIVVLLNARGEARAYPAGRRPPVQDMLWAAGGSLYEVDARLRHARVMFDLPTRGDEFVFSAKVDIEWRVKDAERVVRDGVEDVVRALAPTLRREMAVVTRLRDVVDVADAERDALEVVSLPEIGLRYGLECDFWVVLSTDEATVDHAGARRDIGHKIEIERLTQRLRELEDNNSRERLTAKVESYRVYMEGGRFDHAALRLAQNPDDAAAVAELLRVERDEERRQAIDFITRLIESDAIDRWQIEETVGGALKWLQEAVDNVIRPTGPSPITPTSAPEALSSPEQPTELRGVPKSS